LLPFRNPTPSPRLRPGYRLLSEGMPCAEGLNRLLLQAGDRPRSAERWQRVLDCSLWHLRVEREDGSEAGDETSALVGFVRITSDMALNANLWDLWADREDPACAEVLLALVVAALGRLRRELPGCSLSLSAPPEALQALERQGFVVDPGGIRAMGLEL
jgi:hypothetical protein